jgi:hypothetical protein
MYCRLLAPKPGVLARLLNQMASLLHLALLLSAAAAAQRASSASSRTPTRDALTARHLMQSQKSPTPGSSASNPRKILFDVTIGAKAPDCVSRQVILINGIFQPTITFTQGEYVEVGAMWSNCFRCIDCRPALPAYCADIDCY